MKRILSIILVVILLGIFAISAVSCGGNAYKGGDPKNEAAKKAGGVDAPGGEAATPELDGKTAPPSQETPSEEEGTS